MKTKSKLFETFRNFLSNCRNFSSTFQISNHHNFFLLNIFASNLVGCCKIWMSTCSLIFSFFVFRTDDMGLWKLEMQTHPTDRYISLWTAKIQYCTLFFEFWHPLGHDRPFVCRINFSNEFESLSARPWTEPLLCFSNVKTLDFLGLTLQRRLQTRC